MIRHIMLCAISMLGLQALQAQIPKNISLPTNKLGQPSSQKMDCNDAGTIRFDVASFDGQSNDISLDTIFLCFGDSLQIIHNGDADLTGDPNLATPPGIGYGFYDCRPTITGPDIATILTDPCVNTTSPIVLPGLGSVDQTFGIWVATDEPNGNLTLTNNGVLQAGFNNGDAQPIQFWFAPITLDEFATQGFEDAGAGTGPCVDVAVDEAFSVVFLNAITATDQQVNSSPTGCIGSFMVEGGLPEFNTLELYDIDISLQSDPDVKGQLLNVPNHGDMVEFFVPQPGIYDITVADGKSCAANFNMDLSFCQAVTFQFPLENVPPGQNVCLPITVEDFNAVGSMQFTIEWDPTIITFSNVGAFRSDMPDISTSSFNLTQPGVLAFSWADISFNGVTIPDGETLFEICFDVIGELGDCSPIEMTSRQTPIEIGDRTTPEPFPYGVVVEGGKVVVSDEILFAVLEQDSLSCPDAVDGSFTLTVADGTAPYRFTWNTVPPSGPDQGQIVINEDGGSFTVPGLNAGTYQVTVEDSSNPLNTHIDTIEVLAGPTIGVDLIPTSPSCFGESDGAVQVQLLLDGVIQNNPGPEFTFSWNTTTENVTELTGISSGFYSVVVTDQTGCTASASTTLSQPAALVVLPQNTFPVDASCTGAEDGSITITATGGTTADGNYTYTWDNGLGTVTAASSQITDLNPGEYCVTVTDDNNCVFTDCFTVAAVKTLSITPVITDVSCNGFTDGEIFITGNTTGAPQDLPYTFTWENFTTPPVDNNTTSTLTDLPAGQYIVNMQDASGAGCQVSDTFQVVEPEVLEVTLLEQTNETCVTGQDGSARVMVEGGTPEYTYGWTHNDTLNSAFADTLRSGMYTVTVTDQNSCVDSLEIFILAPTPPNIVSLDDTNVSCPSDTDGELSVVAQGTSADINGYLWSNGSTQTTISNLSPGVYYVTITQENSCAAVDSAFVLSPGPVVLDSFDLVAPQCPGDGDGLATIFASGGTAPYRYTWSTNPGNPTTVNPLPALSAGAYTVTVTDANNCPPLVANFDILDPASIVITLDTTAIVPVSCPDDMLCDGQATAFAAYSDGSDGSFRFEWTSGEVDDGVILSNAAQLCRGAGSLTVSDGTCGETFNFNVGSPEDIDVLATPTPVSCNGLTDGSISISLSGGTAPFNILWTQTGETTTDISNLGAGTYDAVITDANNCPVTQSVIVNEPEVFDVMISDDASTPTVSCSGEDDGRVVVFTTGGNDLGATPYNWANGIAMNSSPEATGLSPGTYAVTVTDTRGCQDSVTYTITEPLPLIVQLAPVAPPLCFGDPAQISIDTITGGAGTDFLDYTYTVNNNLPFPPNITSTVFGAGPHSVIIRDPNGCTDTSFVSVDEPEPIVIDLPDRIVVELGDSLTVLDPIVTPFGGNYSYLWTPGDGLSPNDTVRNPSIFPLQSQQYTFSVTNENGCEAIADVFVELDANRNVYIPNVFAPDGIGVNNDVFTIFTCTGVTNVNFVKLYDRWGGVVYERTNLDPSCTGIRLWDGRVNNQPYNSGVYVYLVEVTFLDGVTLLYRGDVTLLR